MQQGKAKTIAISTTTKGGAYTDIPELADEGNEYPAVEDSALGLLGGAETSRDAKLAGTIMMLAVNNAIVATGKKAAIVDRPLMLFDGLAPSYLDVTDHPDLDFAANESLTLVVAARVYAFQALATLVAKKEFVNNLSGGYCIFTQASGGFSGEISDGSVNLIDLMPVASVGVAHSFAIVRDTAADDIEGHLDGTGSGSPTTDTTTATLANAFALRFGRNSGGGGTPLDGEIMGIALFREALTDAEILAAGKALGAD